ncbi:MAG: hypothetical protein HAW62_01595 [Endozoicomonadaceae bacterium]|nr:hypothetical protein [Endozoicomonadaceae bacterium]
MSNIIDLQATRQFKIRQFDHFIEENLYHPNPLIEAIWKNLSRETMKKYPGIPQPGPLELQLKNKLSIQDQDILSQNISDYIENYIQKIRKIMLEMMSDIILLQREIAEQHVLSES